MIHCLTVVIDYIHQVIENKSQSNRKGLNRHQIVLTRHMKEENYKNRTILFLRTLFWLVLIDNLDKNHYNLIL